MRLLEGDDFEACWQRTLLRVGPVNRRGLGYSEVGRVDGNDWPELAFLGTAYVKRQSRFYCHPRWNFALPTPTFRRELKMLGRAVEFGVRVPEIVAYGEGSRGRAILALAEIPDALDLQPALELARDRQEALLEVGRALAQLHLAGVHHRALYPKHILVQELRLDSGARRSVVTLIDLEKSRSASRPGAWAREDLSRLQRRAQFLLRAEWAVLARGYSESGLRWPLHF